MSRVHGGLVAAAMTVALLGACAPGATTPGGRIFAGGEGHAGAIARSTMEGPYVTQGMACAACHGGDGKGSPLAPNITRAVLGSRHTITHRPSSAYPSPQPVVEGPWTPAQTVETVRTGVTPDGHYLGGRMPRWRLDARDASALALFLRRL